MRFACSTLRRFMRIICVVTLHVIAHFAGRLLSCIPWLARWLPPIGLTNPERLRAVLEDLGGSFVKLGQMLALQPDTLSIEYCRVLSSLLDRVPALPVSEIERVIFEETGRHADELFESFDRTPLASGSIGQVHVGYLNGQKLAVKVQRTDTEANFHRDVHLMLATVWMVRTFRLKFLDWIVDPITEFADWTKEELDFRLEAKYMQQLERNAQTRPTEVVAKVHSEFTTARLLVTDFLPGVTLADHLRLMASGDEEHMRWLAHYGFVPDIFAANIVDNFLADAFEHGIFHADLHPANLMILPNNVVGYIDFGITGVISKYSRQNLVAMTMALARGDTIDLCRRFFALSKPEGEVDQQGFYHLLRSLSAEWYRNADGGQQLSTSTTQIMFQMLQLSRATNVWPQRDVIKYIRSSIALDGLVQRFAPRFNLGSHLAASCGRFLMAHARSELLSHDRILRLWKSAAGLMQDGAFRAARVIERAANTTAGSDSAAGTVAVSSKDVDWRVVFASVLVAIAMVMSWRTDSSMIGLNMHTAQLGVLTLGVCMLLKLVLFGQRRLALGRSFGPKLSTQN